MSIFYEVYRARRAGPEHWYRIAINRYKIQSKLRVRVFRVGLKSRFVFRSGSKVQGANSLTELFWKMAYEKAHSWPNYDLSKRWVE